MPAKWARYAVSFRYRKDHRVLHRAGRVQGEYPLGPLVSLSLLAAEGYAYSTVALLAGGNTLTITGLDSAGNVLVGKRRYAVALTTAIKARDGKPLRADAGFSDARVTAVTKPGRARLLSSCSLGCRIRPRF